MEAERKPKRYRAEFIEPGLISYEDLEAGTVLVQRSALDKMRPTFRGCPVFNLTHKDIGAEQAFNFSEEEKENLADGVVVDAGTLDNGWDYADMMIWNEETKRNLDSGKFSISCAYIPTGTTGGGEYHGIPYDEEVTDGTYTHMAIVENPRYELSKVYENQKNKAQEENVNIFKLIVNGKDSDKKNAESEPDKDDEMENGMDMENAVIETPEGEKIPMMEAMEAYKAACDKENEEGEEQENALSMDDVVEIDGKEVKVADLVKAYQGNQNAEAPQDEKAEPVVDEQKQKQNSAKPKVNKTLQNAAHVGFDAPKIETAQTRISRGKARYGKKMEVKA